MTMKTWEVVPYRAEWPDLFAREAQLLEEIFLGRNARIEHVGSTAVPGLGAKPIIDIMIGVHTLIDAEDRVGELARIKYEYVPEYEAELPDRRYFRKPFTRPRTHHLHVVPFGSDFWKNHLRFRDYLRTHANIADEYWQLKLQLASAARITGVYTENKSPFIARVLALAAEEDS
jgi:GrpB-like predicted nucleotidyltransferase (UPF0157 family)